MGALDAAMKSLGKTLIGVLGGPVTLRRLVTSYNASTGTTSTLSDNSYTINASAPEPFEQKEIDGTNVMIGDTKIMIAGSGLPVGITTLDPKTDTIAFGGETYRVIAVNPVQTSPGQTAVIEVQLRK